ncbi:MAG: L-2-hydroxyglutarate oxidase [Chloroflexi bacterium]|nr:L-2-hydroxyglutarate oxidase [Chloroflexota bacterium]
MTGDRFDLAIIGGGIVGLATAVQLQRRRPDLRMVVLEQEGKLGAHQSGHNSGVLHAGLYYAPGSQKARLCREGKAELEAFLEGHAIPFERCGKLVVALTLDELPRLEELRRRATANGVPRLEEIGPERIREIEPHAAGLRALWSPTTGITDFRLVVAALAREIQSAGGTIETSRRVTGVADHGRDRVLQTSRGPLIAHNVIACAGLWADRVAKLTGDSGRDRIVPFRGDYYTLTADARSLVRGLIYPVADPRFPFLGVHFTRRIDGEVWAGPNAVLAFARTGYRRTDVNLRDLVDTLTDRGFLRLAARFWRMGAVELWRDWSKAAFLGALLRYVPELRADQLVFGPSGVRAQALDPDGTLVDDFRFGGNRHVLHVRNAPSPAATASLAIGRELAERAIERFELTRARP